MYPFNCHKPTQPATCPKHSSSPPLPITIAKLILTLTVSSRRAQEKDPPQSPKHQQKDPNTPRRSLPEPKTNQPALKTSTTTPKHQPPTFKTPAQKGKFNNRTKTPKTARKGVSHRTFTPIENQPNLQNTQTAIIKCFPTYTPTSS